MHPVDADDKMDVSEGETGVKMGQNDEAIWKDDGEEKEVVDYAVAEKADVEKEDSAAEKEDNATEKEDNVTENGMAEENGAVNENGGAEESTLR